MWCGCCCVTVAAATGSRSCGYSLSLIHISTATIDGKTNVVSGKTYVLKDVVGYTNLIPGKEYVITGTVMDKSTGKALEQGGKPVTATAIFTPTEPNGTVELEFTIDTALLLSLIHI